MATIKACPCCAQPARLLENHYGMIAENWVICPECRLGTTWHPSKAEAIAAWNQRARSRLAEMIAGGCGHRGPIHTNECSDECGWFAFWDTDDDADYENRVNGCATEDEAIVALLEKTKAELASLRQEKNEAIGAALAVEQKCYDQAQEIKTLRKLCGEVKVAKESLVSAMLFGPVESGMVSDHQRRLSAALNAYDETIKDTENE